MKSDQLFISNTGKANDFVRKNTIENKPRLNISKTINAGYPVHGF